MLPEWIKYPAVLLYYIGVWRLELSCIRKSHTFLKRIIMAVGELLEYPKAITITVPLSSDNSTTLFIGLPPSHILRPYEINTSPIKQVARFFKQNIIT